MLAAPAVEKKSESAATKTPEPPELERAREVGGADRARASLYGGPPPARGMSMMAGAAGWQSAPRGPSGRAVGPVPMTPLRPSQGGLIQRKCACGGTPGPTGECEACHAGRLGMQAKLMVSQPGDAYEQEADRVAERVVSMAQPRSERPWVSAGEPSGRQGGEPAAARGRVQLQVAGSGGPAVAKASPIANGALRSPGQPLDPAARAFMEPRFGSDFSQVRIHTGAEAEASADAISARAFTIGNDIVFGRGEFRPNSVDGRKLLAHELAHVVQQGHAPGPSAATCSRAAASSGATGAAPAMIMRQPRIPSQIDRRLALRELRTTQFVPDPTDAFGPLVSSWLVDVYALVADDGLPSWLDMTVVKLLNPTLETWRTLSAWARIPLNEADTFAARVAVWQSIRELATHTDDPALVDAAEKAGHALPYLVGTRWSQLKAFLETIARRADASVSKWRWGLHSLYPLLGRVIDKLPEAIQKGLDDPETPARIREDVLTVLGYPATASGADVSWSIQAAHKQWDDWIVDLSTRAERMTGAAGMSGSLGAIAGEVYTARALRDDLKAMVAILRRPDGLIGERERLAALLPPIRQRLDLLNDPLEQASRIEPAALGGPLYDLGNWSKAPVLAYFPGDFDWIAPVADKAGPWASEQEPQVFSAAQESLLGIDRWSALVAETVAEEDTLDEEVPTMPRGWWDIGAHLAWLFKYNKKEIIERLKKSVPLLRELTALAPDLWRRATGLFERFVERIFKEGRILAPLWEFFLGVIGLLTPGEFVKDIADRAGSLLGKILKSALKFLKNLGKAVGGGINLFRARIGEHLMGVFQEWLFGELDLTGPFNLRTLLKALLEQVGISLRNVYEHIAAYVSEHIRPITAEVVEEKVQNALKTIEKAAGAIRTAMHWLQLLMGGKYAELWEEIKAYLSELWSRIWEEARSKLIEYIIKELRAKLLKLLDPTGISQVLEGIKWLYDAIKTVIAYGERILAMVRQVFGAIKDIADGKIDEAAALVERALVFGTSVVFSFLARALGLDKAVQEFKNALKGLKKYVDRGLSALVRAAGKAWEWIVGKVGEIKEWWEGRRKFTDQDGNTREIYFDPASSDHPILVSDPEGTVSAKATPPTLGKYITDLEKGANSAELKIIAIIKDLAKGIDNIKQAAGGSFSAKQGEEIRNLFNEIVGQLSRLGGTFDPPPTVVHWDEKTIDGEKHGAFMRADPLSIDPGGYIGSKPSDAPTKLWDTVRKVPRGGASWYIQGHLLNHNVHGPGIWKNMAPIARTTNTKMEREDDGRPTPGGVEDKVKHAVLDEHKVVCYEVRMVYGKHKDTPATVAEGKLPSRIEMYAVQLVFRKGKWEPTSKVIASKTLENEIRTK